MKAISAPCFLSKWGLVLAPMICWTTLRRTYPEIGALLTTDMTSALTGYKKPRRLHLVPDIPVNMPTTRRQTAISEGKIHPEEQKKKAAAAHKKGRGRKSSKTEEHPKEEVVKQLAQTWRNSCAYLTLRKSDERRFSQAGGRISQCLAAERRISKMWSDSVSSK